MLQSWVQTLNDFRQESHEVLNIFGQCDATLPAAKRRKTLSSKVSERCVLTTVGQKESNRDKNVFLTTFFYPVIDLSLGEITRRRILEAKLWHNEQHLGSQAQKKMHSSKRQHFCSIFLFKYWRFGAWTASVQQDLRQKNRDWEGFFSSFPSEYCLLWEEFFYVKAGENVPLLYEDLKQTRISSICII